MKNFRVCGHAVGVEVAFMLTMRLRFYDVALAHVTIQITIIHWWVKDQRATTIWCQEKNMFS